jgi:hypothetical protein
VKPAAPVNTVAEKVHARARSGAASVSVGQMGRLVWYRVLHEVMDAVYDQVTAQAGAQVLEQMRKGEER